MSAPEIRQAPGWWPSLVQVVHDECGHRGPVRDLNAARMADVRVRIERDTHVCGPDEEAPDETPEEVAFREGRQCYGPVYSIGGGAPERCAYPEGHPGECEA